MRIINHSNPWWWLLLGLMSMTTLVGCFSDDDEDLQGNWVRRSDFEGVPRSNAVAFTIGDFAYVGLGFDGEDDLRDFWRYDPQQDFWTQVDSFPGPLRRAAVAFAVGDKGFVGTGFDSEDEEEFADFWAFDPAAPSGTQWSQVSDFAGAARYDAVAFSDGTYGYVGTGFNDNWLKDFYRYDPANDSWEQVVSLGGSKREAAVAFSNGGSHFVCTGRNNGVYEFDFWHYEASGGNWTRLTDINEDDFEIARHGAVAFTLGDRSYLATGSNGSNLSSVWEYDPGTDEWEEKTGFEGALRLDAVAFVVQGRAYVTTGRSSATRFDDLREFLPNEAANEDD